MGPEPVRLVVWDLDDTFWHGTLTEGGMAYRRDAHDIVVALARRGIPSAICSKNDMARVRPALERAGIWDYFVFPSIDWTPKGPRLAAMVDAVQLRPASILFIDDNAMNLAEAAYFVPGIQVAGADCIAGLLDNPLCRGKDDARLERLAQYKLLEKRHGDARATGDNAAFLRGSGITVRIEHDLAPHIDRAIELINRTNQLNFTKERLPEEADAARQALLGLLARHSVQAGIVQVRDRYGDYGYCGLFVLVRPTGQPARLRHFCFSCRILNMGVETWLYRELGRPVLKVRGEVLGDVAGDTREIDWITPDVPAMGPGGDARAAVDVVCLRGGCDMQALAHYFGVAAGLVIEEFNEVRGGMAVQRNHSVMAVHALRGAAPELVSAAARFGYVAADFTSFVAEGPRAGTCVWILSFSQEYAVKLYRHRASGGLLPIRVKGEKQGMIDPALLAFRKAHFELVGATPDALFTENIAAILARAPAGCLVFILLGNTRVARKDGGWGESPLLEQRNRLIAEAASGFPGVVLLDVWQFARDGSGLEAGAANHFDRMVYFRVFEHVMGVVGTPGIKNGSA